MKILSSIGGFILDIIETVVVSLAIFVVVYVFIAQPHQVKGDSMLPNFHTGEYILTSKLTYKFGDVKRGDIIVFKYPNAPQYDYIKRVIGLPGETIELKGGFVYIYNESTPQGFAIDEYYLDKEVLTYGRSFLQDGAKYKIPGDNFFVMGDNREKSSDSRQWGPLPSQNIIGKSWFRYWPPSAFALLETPDYNK